MKIRIGYCRFCSVEKEDERVLVFDDRYITCEHCGRRLVLIPESEGSPYYFFKEVKKDGDES